MSDRLFAAELGRTPVGSFLCDLFVAFKTDPGLRKAAFCRKGEKHVPQLFELESSVARRQLVVPYYRMLHHLIHNVVEGRDPQTISWKAEAWVQEVRSYWFSQPGYALLVRQVYDLLGVAIEAFDHQMVLGWMLDREEIEDPFEYLAGLTPEEIQEQRREADILCSTRACSLLGIYERKLEKLAAMPQAKDPVGRIFCMTPGQQALYAEAQRKMDDLLEGLLSLLEVTQANLAPPPPDVHQPSGWEFSNGILIPK